MVNLKFLVGPAHVALDPGSYRNAQLQRDAASAWPFQSVPLQVAETQELKTERALAARGRATPDLLMFACAYDALLPRAARESEAAADKSLHKELLVKALEGEQAQCRRRVREGRHRARACPTLPRARR